MNLGTGQTYQGLHVAGTCIVSAKSNPRLLLSSEYVLMESLIDIDRRACALVRSIQLQTARTHRLNRLSRTYRQLVTLAKLAK